MLELFLVNLFGGQPQSKHKSTNAQALIAAPDGS